jgi:lipopolysaccharide/colanic/teichoic acid biosynthesis glycosyltransferase
MLSSIGESRPSFGERYYYEAAKRGFDLVFVTLALPVWIPLLLIVAVMVRIFLGSPVPFRHKRPGLHGRIFQILKFRTMRNDRDSMGNLLSDSERLTRLATGFDPLRWMNFQSLSTCFVAT